MEKTIKFINKAKIIHNDKYDYSKTTYVNSHDKLMITCEKHGDFEMTPTNHLSGRGCKLCGYENSSVKQRNSKEKFVQKSMLKHGTTFNYEKVNYINSATKVIITCKIHGDFKITPDNHIAGQGCPICGGTNKKTNEEIINQFKTIHGIDKYDYSLINYLDSHTKIKIICLIHGVFEQTPDSHLRGCGCPKCSGKNKTTIDLINQYKTIHGANKYDYSNVNFINNRTKVTIKCKKHGDFICLPSNHLQGKGCPICRESKGEKLIREYLTINKIGFIPQYKYSDCKHKNILPFDFYIPYYNTCVEYQGIQHFKPIMLFGGEQNLKIIQYRDKIKMDYCVKNNIRLIIIKYNEDVNEKLNILLK